MAQAMTFPREYERQFWRDMDKRFALIWIICFVLINILFIQLAQTERRVMSAAELKKYNEVVYRTQITPVVKPKERPTATATADVATEAAVEAPVAASSVSAEQRAAMRAEAKANREAMAAARKAEIASKIGVLAGPTSKGGRRGRGSGPGGRGGGGAAAGLTAGGFGGADISKTIGFATGAGDADKVRRLRGGGGLSDEDIDLGGINIGDALRAMSSSQMGLMLKEAPVELNKSAVTASGKGSKTQQRSQQAISDMVLANKNQVQYCYWRMKRKDSGLQGKVQMRFEILASGAVTRVAFKSQWSGNAALGKEVEVCIENVVKSWRFDAIAESEGTVTAGATYVFE